MPILGPPPSVLPDPSEWVLVGRSAIETEMAKISSQDLPPEQWESRMNVVLQALQAANAGQAVWTSRDLDDRVLFAAAPRFVPEEDLPFNVDEVICEASYILNGAGLDFELSDDEPQQAIREALLSEELIQQTPYGWLFDSFADERYFQGVITAALEWWEMNLPETKTSEQEEPSKPSE